MNTQRWFLILVLLALLAAGGWWFFRSRNTDGSGENSLKPHLSVASVNVTDIDPDRIKMTARMFLSNPLPIEFKSNRLDYQLLIDSVKVLESSYSKPIIVRSSDSTAIELPMELLLEQVGDVIKRFEANKTDSADYTLQATVYADVPIAGERQFNFDQTKRLPAVRLPKIKLEKVDVGKLGLKESTLTAVITVTNPNQFPFKFRDARYTAKVGQDLNVNGQIPGVTNVPAQGSAPIAITMDARTGNVGRLAWKALFDKKDVPFRVNFSTKLVTENDLLKNSNMAFNVNGTLEELKKVNGDFAVVKWDRVRKDTEKQSDSVFVNNTNNPDMKQSTPIWILAAVTLTLLGLGGWYYWRLKNTPSEAPGQALKPELSVLAIDVSDISEEEINLTVRLYLRNPYPVDLRARRLDYQVLIDSTKIIENAYTEPLTIKSGDSAVIKLPMALQADEFKKVIKGIKARQQDSANYTIRAKIFADVPVLGERAFGWETTKRMPAYQLPTIKLEGLKVDKLGLKESNLEAEISFYNPNVFDMQVRDVRYVLTVGQQDNLRAVATRPGVTRIPSGSTTLIPIQIQVELDQAGKFIGQALFAQSKTPLELVATFEFISDKEFTKGSKLALKLTGTLDEFTKKPVRLPPIP